MPKKSSTKKRGHIQHHKLVGEAYYKIANLFSRYGSGDPNVAEIANIITNEYAIGDRIFFQNVPQFHITTKKELKYFVNRVYARFNRKKQEDLGFKVSVRVAKDSSGFLIIKLPVKD